MQHGTAATTTIDRTLDYGVDAPEVTRMFFLIGTPLLATGAALIGLIGAVWATWLGGLVMLAALATLTLGVMMRLYAWRGKLRSRDWVLARHGWQGTETVLTIGAARKVQHGVVHAIDIWRAEDLTGNGEAGLRTNIASVGLKDRVQIHTMDARAMTFADGSIDVILSLLCLHNIEDRQTACREIARVLMPGGVAFIADYIATRSSAAAFAAQGLAVTGPTNAIPVALSLMFLVEARKPLT